MQFKIQNEFLSATISAKGAELQSLYGKQTGIEYLWNGDEHYWAKHSPVLFPIVGTLRENSYFYKEKEYHLPRHGFARDKQFAGEKISDTEIVFTLSDSAETLLAYPFSFILRLRYCLAGAKLICTYEVENPGMGELLFSVGGHPAFAAPISEDSVYEDYYLQWQEEETLYRWKLHGGLIAEKGEPLPMKQKCLFLKHDLFYEDAVVIKHMHSKCITLKNKKNEHGIHFHFDGFPFFGIWAAIDAPFVCLEPWCGIADSINHNKEISDKEGIEKLAPNSGWQRTWAVDCF